jgi:hypothetical protein
LTGPFLNGEHATKEGVAAFIAVFAKFFKKNIAGNNIFAPMHIG